jgi:hypothetical protein
LRLAVGELAREARDVERALADDLARLARGVARLRREDGLLDDLLGRRRVLLEERPSLSETTFSTMPFTSLETSFDFVCESNDGSGCFTLMTQVRPSRMSSPARPCFRSLKRFCAGAVVVDRLRERRAKTREVRAAVLVVDVVRVAIDLLGVRGVPLQRDLDRDGAAPSCRSCVASLLAAIEMTSSWSGLLRLVEQCSTNSAMPPCVEVALLLDPRRARR